MNPLNWTAQPFLTFYVCLAAAALLAVLGLRAMLGPRGPEAGADGLGAVELGYLAGGRARAADTALVGFFAAGVIKADERGGEFAASRLMGAPAGLMDYYEHVVGCSRKAEFHQASRARFERVQDELVAWGLLAGKAAVERFWTAAAAVVAVPVAVGVAKIIIGSERGHPVGILCCLVAITVVLGLVIAASRPYRTRLGSHVLAAARTRHARAARAPMERELMLAFALSGAAVLAGMAYRGFFVTSGGDAGGADGGGSGCGGGGCGGCGG